MRVPPPPRPCDEPASDVSMPGAAWPLPIELPGLPRKVTSDGAPLLPGTATNSAIVHTATAYAADNLRARGSHNPKCGFRNPGNVRGPSKQSKVWSAITAQWLLCTNDCWCVQCKMPTVTRLSPFLINTANDHVMVLQGIVDLSQTMPAAKLWCDLWTQLTGQHKTWVGVCTNTHPP